MNNGKKYRSRYDTPRDLLASIVAANPKADEAEVRKLFREQAARHETILALIVEQWFLENLRSVRQFSHWLEVGDQDDWR